jgi:hypothetical protein
MQKLGIAGTVAAMLRRFALRALVAVGGLGFILGSAALAAKAAAGSSAATDSSLMGEWHMDEVDSHGNAGSSTPDSSGNGNDMAIDGPTQVAGRWGNAFHFNGGGARLSPSVGYQPARLTAVAWVKGSPPGLFKDVLSQGDDPNSCSNASYSLYTSSNGGLSFYIGTGTGRTINSAAAGPGIWDGNWHAVAGVYDGTTVRLYVDGSEIGAPTDATGSSIDYSPQDFPEDRFEVGDFFPCPGFEFSGAIDEVRIYSRALTAQEIAQLQDPSAGSPPELAPPTSSTSSTTPSSTTSAGSPPPLSASLRVLPSPSGGSPILSAAGTTGATRLLYDLGGDHRPDLSLSPSMPYTQVTLPRGGAATVALTAVGSSAQQTSRASTTLKLPGLGLPPRVESTIPQVAVSSSSTAAFARIPPASLRASLCVPTEVDVGVIGANGCLKHLSDPGEVPASEAAVANQYWGPESVNGVYTNLCVVHKIETPANCAYIKTEFGKVFSDYLASTPIKLNGMTLTPRGGASIVIDPLATHVFSSDATLKLGPFVIKQGNVDLDFTDIYRKTGSYSQLSYTGQTGTLLSFDARKDVPVIGGFPLNAGAELQFAADNGVRKSVATLHVELPKTFDAFGSGDQPSGAVSVSATNDRGFFLDTLDLKLPHASIGGIGLDNVEFQYADGGDNDPAVQCPSKYWHATGDIELGEAEDGQPAGVLMTPPPENNGVSFCQGNFKGVGAQLNFGCPLLCPPQLFPGVFLDNLHFDVGLNPTLIRGGGEISAAELTKISGTMLAVFAHPWATYTLTASEAGTDLQDLAGRTFSSTSFAFGGAIAVQIPGVGDLNIAHGGAVYEYPDFIGLGAHVDLQLGVFEGQVTLGAHFSVGRGLFEIDASGDVHIRGIKDSGAGGLLVASEKGAVVCVDFFGLNPGFGVGVDGHIDLWIPDGCKPSHYWSASHDARASAAAGAGTTINIARGETVKSVKLVGAGGAPRVRIAGPNRQSLSVAADGGYRHGALLGLSASTYDTTWLGFKNARPGRYTVTVLPGSAPIAAVAMTRPGYDTNFSARVSGHGNRLTLHFDARKRGGGQRVTFFEDAASVMHPLVTSTGGTGTIHFTPAPGAGGIRTIVARATVDGVPIRSQTLARFHFSGTPRTGRPHTVTVHRRGRALVVKWTPAKGAIRYGVLVNLSDGSQRQYVVSAARRTLAIRRFPLSVGGRVSVSARGVLGDWGPAHKSATFKAVEQPPSVLLTRKFRERKPKRSKHH